MGHHHACTDPQHHVDDAEGFVSEEAHRLHESTEHMRALWAVGPDLLDRVDIHNLVASTERKQERFDRNEEARI